MEIYAKTTHAEFSENELNLARAYKEYNEGSKELDDDQDFAGFDEITTTHEPIENFRPENVMTGKRAGREEQTSFGTLVIREGFQKSKGAPRMTMVLMSFGNETIVGFRS